MALLTALALGAADRGWTVLAAHYDHGLRGEESRRDRDFVTAWCAEQRIPLTVGAGDVAGQAKETRRGIEETARSMRYVFLHETARAVGAGVIATAHNAEDNVETVLLHLTRGAGLDGLTGIPPRRGKLVRPLLASSRDEIDAFLARQGVPWVEDSTNAQTVYARNRIRREVLPVLKELNPNLTETLTANLARLRADRDWLNAQAKPVLELAEKSPGRVAVPASALSELPPTVAAKARSSMVLPVPGTSSSRTWPPAIRQTMICSITSSFPTMTRLQLSVRRRLKSTKALVSIGFFLSFISGPRSIRRGRGRCGRAAACCPRRRRPPARAARSGCG